MQPRLTLLGFLCLTFLFTIGCGQEQKPVVIVVQEPAKPKDEPKQKDNEVQPVPKVDPVDPMLILPAPPLTPQDKYDAAVAAAFRFLSEKKDEAALASLLEAQAAVDTDFVKGEIERLKANQTRATTAEKTTQDIKTVLESGKAAEASKLASDALVQFGDGDAAATLGDIKRQADAVLAAQLAESERKKQFIEEAETARKAQNFRAALVAYDQAVASGTDVTALKPDFDDLRTKLTRYDDQRTRAAELRRDPARLEEAIAALKEARDAWKTPQVEQEIQEAEVALNSRRDRLSVADFEVVGDVGIPLAGRTIAEEILPYFKGRYELAERSQVGAILQELKLDPAILQVSDEGRAELGKLAKARYLVVGSVSRLSGISINARLIDVQSGLIVQTAKIVASTPKELMAKLPSLARILQMSDEQKIANDQELAQAATPEPEALKEVPPPPVPPEPEEVVPPPIVVESPRPPELGNVEIADFDNIPPLDPQPQTVVIVETEPSRRRAFFVAIELGDNFFRRGRFVDAYHQYEFALSLAPGREDVRFRMDRCRPFLPPAPVVVVVPTRPRLAVLPFVELGRRGFVPIGFGAWTADNLAQYLFPAYDIVDRGEVSWWMNRLGLRYRDVLVDPSARLLLARALGVRFFLMFDVTSKIVDAEFNAQVSSGRIRVRNPHELKLRLNELANLTLMPPVQRAVFVEQTVVVKQRIEQAQIQIGNGKFSIAIGIYKDVLVQRPDCVEARVALIDAERRHRQWEFEQTRQQAYAQERARIQVEQQRQLFLAAEAERQRRDAERVSAAQAEAQRRAFARQQEDAHVQLLIQARNAAKGGQFAVSINLFQNATALRRTPEAVNEMAAVRAQFAEKERVRQAQEAAAREQLLRQQRDRESQAARQTLLAEQQRLQLAEKERQRQQEAQAKEHYNRLLDQAQQAKVKGQHDVAVSNLQSARSLKPSPEIDQLVTAALIDQAKAEADRKGADERKKLEAQLAAEQKRRQQAEIEAAQHKAKHDTAINLGRAAMREKKFAEARRQFQLASATLNSDEAAIGLKQANDEMAQEKAAADAALKTQEAAQKNEAEVARLTGAARQFVQSKNFPAATQSMQAAIKLKPSSVELQQELIKIQQARDEHSAAIRKQKDDQDRQVNFKKHLDAGQANLTAKNYDAAIVALNDALKINPNDATAQAALKEAQGAVKLDTQAQIEAKKKRDAYEKAMQQGRTALSLKNHDAAIESFKAAQQILPGDLTSTQMLRDAEKMKADADTANATRIKAAAVNQAIARARAAIKLNKFDDAITAIADAGKVDPSNMELKKVQQELADARNNFAATQKMREDAERKLKFSNTIATARQQMSTMQLGQAEKTLAEAKQIAAADPQNAAMQKELADTQTALQGALANAKTQSGYDTAFKAAGDFMKLGKFAEAEQQYLEALKAKPKDPIAEDGLKQARAGLSGAANAAKTKMAYDDAMKTALAAFAANRFDESIAAAQSALKLVPNDAAATQMLDRAGKGKTAIQGEIDRKKNYDAAMLAARTAMQVKQFQVASDNFTQALKFAPNDPAATQGLNEARVALTPPKPKVDPVKVAYDSNITGARTAFTQKQYAEAMRLGGEALKLIPNDPEATKIINDSRLALTPPKKDPPKVDPAKVAYEQHMTSARNAFAQKQYQAAITYANEALKLMPTDTAAAKIVSDSKVALTPPPPPKKEPAPPPKVDPAKVAHEQFMTGARNAFAQKKYQVAIQLAGEALKLVPTDAEAMKIVNDSKVALTPPPPPKKADPPPPPKVDPVKAAHDQHMANARNAFAQKQYQAAITSASEALKLVPNNAEATNIVNVSRAALIPPPPPPPKKVDLPPPPKKNDVPVVPKKVDPPPPPPPAKVDPAKAAYDQFMAAARNAFAQKQYQVAIQQASEALKLVPTDAEAAKIVNDSRAALVPPKKK
ncbi:MAG: hypothetical protein K8T89_05255 [Planctomycetes bacterium]|nr:hypothetical protein [Planctomycetota bacterium]